MGGAFADARRGIAKGSGAAATALTGRWSARYWNANQTPIFYGVSNNIRLITSGTHVVNFPTGL
jgi:hypothetical protein